MRALLLLLTLLALAGPGWATIYYLDSEAAGGGDGSQGTPWNSVATAEAGTTTGDTVRIIPRATAYTVNGVTFDQGVAWTKYGAGTVTWSNAGSLCIISGTDAASWTGITFNTGTSNAYCVRITGGATSKTFTTCTFVCNNSGSTTNPVTFGSETVDTTGITFSGCTWTATSCYAAIRVLNSTGTHLRSFTLTDCDITVTTAVSTILQDGTTQTGTIAVSGGSIAMTVASGTPSMFYIAGNESLSVTDVTLTVTGNGYGVNMPTAATTGALTYRGNTVSTGSIYPTITSNTAGSTHAIDIADNTITSTLASSGDNAYQVIYIKDNPNVRIVGNRINAVAGARGVTAIKIAASSAMSGIYIADNVIRSKCNGTGGVGEGAYAWGISVGTGGQSNDVDGAVIIRNQVFGPYAVDETAHGGFHCIEFEDAWTVVEGNYVAGGLHGVVAKGQNYNAAYKGGIVGNIAVNNLYDGVFVHGITRQVVEHNTIYSDITLLSGGSRGANILLDAGANGGYAGGGQYALVRWNISYTKGGEYSVGHIAATGDYETVTGFTSYENCFWSTTGTAGVTFNQDIGTADETFAQWQALGTNYDADSLVANPRWILPRSSNFALRISSPCIPSVNKTSAWRFLPQRAWGAVPFVRGLPQ